MIKRTLRGLVFGLYILVNLNAFGQQRFLNNQRMWNDMMFNPAKIVQTPGLAVYANHRQQYYTLGSQSPYILIIGGKGNLPTAYSQNMLVSEARKKTKYNYAVGGYYIHSYSGGVYDQNEVAGQFAFQLKLHQNVSNPSSYDQINFGLTVKGINNRYRGNSVFNLYDSNDPVFSDLQVSNKFAVSAIPGIQYLNSSIMLDALYTFGPKDQQFGSLTLMGSTELDNYFDQLAFRVSYFGNPNCQVAINKVQELGWGFNQSWSLNYGANVFIGKKFVANSSALTNPGIYLGLIYTNTGNPKKTRAPYKVAQHQNVFSGSLNLFDANFNTLALGPSAELGLMYQRNSTICECDRIYDQFNIALRSSNLAEMKALESKYNAQCNVPEYLISYRKYSPLMRDEIKEKEADLSFEQPVELATCVVGNQEWACKPIEDNNLFGITLIKSEEEWKKQSEKKACCCYWEFNENNKGYGLMFNAKALEEIKRNLPNKLPKFRIADKPDWIKLIETAKNNGTLSSLFNCDNRNNAAFHLNPNAYFDEAWYPPTEGLMGYWVLNGVSLVLSCNDKSQLMFDDTFTEDDRSKNAAFMIWLIKK
jgi:hypothetical protein